MPSSWVDIELLSGASFKSNVAVQDSEEVADRQDTSIVAFLDVMFSSTSDPTTCDRVAITTIASGEYST